MSGVCCSKHAAYPFQDTQSKYQGLSMGYQAAKHTLASATRHTSCSLEPMDSYSCFSRLCRCKFTPKTVCRQAKISEITACCKRKGLVNGMEHHSESLSLNSSSLWKLWGNRIACLVFAATFLLLVMLSGVLILGSALFWHLVPFGYFALKAATSSSVKPPTHHNMHTASVSRIPFL